MASEIKYSSIIPLADRRPETVLDYISTSKMVALINFSIVAQKSKCHYFVTGYNGKTYDKRHWRGWNADFVYHGESESSCCSVLSSEPLFPNQQVRDLPVHYLSVSVRQSGEGGKVGGRESVREVRLGVNQRSSQWSTTRTLGRVSELSEYLYNYVYTLILSVGCGEFKLLYLSYKLVS